MESSLNILEGVMITPLKKIYNPKGDVYHALKSTDSSFFEFGEAYFTEVNKDDVKGWKLHKKMTMNLIVPVGIVGFYFHNENVNKNAFIAAGRHNYVRITVQPGIWMAFKGMADELNLVLNVANVSHDPSESINASIDTFPLSNNRD